MHHTFPFFVIHYTRLPERRRYIEGAFASLAARDRFEPQFITAFDREVIDVDAVYASDEATYRDFLRPIKNVLIGYVVGLQHAPTASFRECVDWYTTQNTDLNFDFNRWRWLLRRCSPPT
jgi:hypothetical protein